MAPYCLSFLLRFLTAFAFTSAALIPSPSPAPAPSPSTAAIPLPTLNATNPTPSPVPTQIPSPTNTTTTAPSPIQIPNTTTAPPTYVSTLNTSTAAAAPTPPREGRLHRQQLNNIVDALIGAGDFNGWANILSVADPITLPLSATLFIPADDSRSPISTTMTIDPFIFSYHIVPQRLSFADLRQFKLYSRLPTLLPSKHILITNNSSSNFTLDDSLLSHPDLFITGTVAVHGMATLMDYSVYGDAKPKPSQPEVLSRPPPAMFEPSGEVIDDKPDIDAACLCTEVWPVFLVFCAVLASKIQRMSLGR
ncbi:hypothetical protein P3X46_019949 [Hevea brasiliensis]|uniref:FAS1 domain-containing protein n=1 Tax=Hevea brasiliensis TaxID=3981 RepID=A0ABQ9LKF8_HEVBR|nr:FAS1 domain-containing protein SELMODRAFT_448915 [Hevea brasiliensis]KAJ9168424.1 hypothetical protein P3X46_019949 [Hevea brasiliensis]